MASKFFDNPTVKFDDEVTEVNRRDEIEAGAAADKADKVAISNAATVPESEAFDPNDTVAEPPAAVPRPVADGSGRASTEPPATPARAAAGARERRRVSTGARTRPVPAAAPAAVAAEPAPIAAKPDASEAGSRPVFGLGRELADTTVTEIADAREDDLVIVFEDESSRSNEDEADGCDDEFDELKTVERPRRRGPEAPTAAGAPAAVEPAAELPTVVGHGARHREGGSRPRRREGGSRPRRQRTGPIIDKRAAAEAAQLRTTVDRAARASRREAPGDDEITSELPALEPK